MNETEQRELADLIAAYYRREIGVLMHQAEHWQRENFPLAVQDRLQSADTYFQVVVLFERFAQWNKNPFDKMREEMARPPFRPPGPYPPTPDLHRYRDPRFVVEQLKTASREAGGTGE